MIRLFPLSLFVLAGCPAEPVFECLEESGTQCVWMGVPGIEVLSADGADRLETQLSKPQDLAFAEDGSAWVLDFNNHRIRRVGVDGIVMTEVGTGFLGDPVDGDALLQPLNHPTGLLFDPNNPDLLTVAAWHNSKVLQVDVTTGALMVIAGTGGRSFGGDGGQAKAAVLDLPAAVTYDDLGNLYISDQANQVIRKVAPDGVISTIAGTIPVPGPSGPVKQPGYSGDGGPALGALLQAQVGQAADPSSRLTWHDGKLYLADTGNHRIRAIDLATGLIDTVVGDGTYGSGGDGGPALDAQLLNPRDVAFGPDGEMYIADTGNHCVRVVGTDGVINTFAGVCGEAGTAEDGLPAAESPLAFPYGIDLDADGNLYIADTYNQVFRVVYR
jgi:hypothetical protein